MGLQFGDSLYNCVTYYSKQNIFHKFNHWKYTTFRLDNICSI